MLEFEFEFRYFKKPVVCNENSAESITYYAHKICLQVSGTKYPVISNSYQVSGTKSK